MILDKIVETKKEEVAQSKKEKPLAGLQAAISELQPCRNFKAAISGSPSAIIAEVKCASPSRGRLVENFDPLKIAATYEKNGAAAISVLTDEKYFMGRREYLTQIKTEVKLPLLRKDFIIDPYQIYESRTIGADAVLLIVRSLGARLGEFIELAGLLGLAALTEVHTAAELEIALAHKADIIGINNRNLDTFVTDINTCKELARSIPAGIVTVAESGIRNRDDIENIMQSGVRVFLIGEALVTSSDIGKKLKEFRGEQVHDAS
ncbi:MAG: indole-3-glycerol phosphate synthase TrpC [Syntrophaceae bacterium]|nr:indole-3-glycerol phosphate synthase TrpC [Syntrophaceae bacterium]